MAINPDTTEQDEALARRHEERERITHAVENGEVPHGSICKSRIEIGEVTVTKWRFPGEEARIQITANRDKVKHFGNGYMVLTPEGAKDLRDYLGSLLFG